MGIVIHGREYQVEVDPEPCPLDGSRVYVLTGKKGARYHTYKPNPWLTDRSGTLEVASS